MPPAKSPKTQGLYDHTLEYSSCGVGFLTRKDGVQSHDVLLKGHEALCAVPHRGGMSSEGVGDGAGISLDLSVAFFSHITKQDLQLRRFGVGNFFLPNDESQHERACELIESTISRHHLKLLKSRELPVDPEAIGERSHRCQLPIRQWIFAAPDEIDNIAFESSLYAALMEIEAVAYGEEALAGLYPLSFSARTQVLKGRLNSWEIVPYFLDLRNPQHSVHTMYFHTRFSTNTDPHPSMAQPFRMMAHNGELNTDKKNRLSETARAMARQRAIIRPPGQSDSCRLDQTLYARVSERELDLVTAVVSMMPPAWENDEQMAPDVRAMLEYFSLFEEKNDGPAALVFGDGNIIGARLDRLGLRPLRSVETETYLAVMSEAGQVAFPPSEVLRRGRVEAGGMIYYDHEEGRLFTTKEALARLAKAKDYQRLLSEAQVPIDSLPEPEGDIAAQTRVYDGTLNLAARYVAYNHNQESFKFLMDPMLQNGKEKVSAMGYGNAINALSDNEGGVAKYFSQRFAQVTNPPLDSIREADGMTLRVALGEKPHLGHSRSRQIVVGSPVLRMSDMMRIRAQSLTPWAEFEALYVPVVGDAAANELAMTTAIDFLADQIAAFARQEGGIAIISDRHVSRERACLPMTIVVSAVNQVLVQQGLRFKVSLVVESGQISSSHHIACSLGFGAAAVYPIAVRMRAEELYGGEEATQSFYRYQSAAEKALMKTMGKVGLCTVESYSGGEFFEPNFLDTNDAVFAKYLPNMKTPVGGVRFCVVAQSVVDWHERALSVETPKEIPILGLFKERSEGAGHSYGTSAVRGFVDLTEETVTLRGKEDERTPLLPLLTLRTLGEAYGIDEEGYVNTSFDALTPESINSFHITPGYRTFVRSLTDERARRPSALRDILAFPADIRFLSSAEEFKREMMLFNRAGNIDFVIRGLSCEQLAPHEFSLQVTGDKAQRMSRLDALGQSLVERFGKAIESHWIESGKLRVQAVELAADYLSRLRSCADPIALDQVQPASEIMPTLASGAMSHGALVAVAHEAVAHGTNMVGAMSNSGEGGEHYTRYGTIRGSRIKQFASGRFGVWAGYLADPGLQEIEIKIGQGAKPGEGGQLPAHKVTVEIAAARGGTPGVELVSPPPHHDTYSIEDLGILIHDAKAARVKVIVKLVSSEGIGTIAVGVAKAGADVINVAGNTGGTGAASVTSLKYTGRSAEIGVAEVHQALCANSIRQKVKLRCSGAMQTGTDVVKTALLGADSFEFGTTALMMLKCVMAKNCNVKCPAGLTTNPEVFDGDPRALGQYLLNVAHEVREHLAHLGLRSLKEARGRTDLLHLLDHSSSVGKLNLRAMLTRVSENVIASPIYIERDYSIDDALLEEFTAELIEGDKPDLQVEITEPLNNRNKSVGGQLSIDIERLLNHQLKQLPACALEDSRGRKLLAPETLSVSTHGSAGQSFGAFCNDGMVLRHTGTCNDGVGKGANGGEIIVLAPEGGSRKRGENVLIGNFAYFGATGGRLFVEGEAGDRFAVRNSGATAVVEGVGDFFAEYMTNGAVLNIGGFAKGVGNGMSGGFVYQYDPENELEEMVSKDSVLCGSLKDAGAQTEIHADAIRLMLHWHVEATGSKKAADLLENWQDEMLHMKWVMPRTLLQYQDADEILRASNRKALLEELALSLAAYAVSEVKKSWRSKVPVHKGAVPRYGETDTNEMFQLICSYLVIEASKGIAEKFVGDGNPRALDRAQRNIILTEDYGLMAELAKYARLALSEYDETQLAVLVANKRLYDFKRALATRNVQSMDSPGTYRWIIHLTTKNREALGHVPSFDELFAEAVLGEKLETMQVPYIPNEAPFSEDQKSWLAGFLAGLHSRKVLHQGTAVESTAAAAVKLEPIDILYGTQTGNAESVANDAADLAKKRGFLPRVRELDAVSMDELAQINTAIVAISTYGEGEMPDNAAIFWHALSSPEAPRLEQLKFGVIALGDTSYDEFCQAGKLLDMRLEQLGAQRMGPRLDCDVEYEDPAALWLDTTVPVAKGGDANAQIEDSQKKAKFGKKNPYPSKVLENTLLSGPKSAKEIRHFSFDLGDSGFSYESGDALGVVPVNDQKIVDQLLGRLDLKPDQILGNHDLGIGELLRTKYEIRTPSKNFIETLAEQNAHEELTHLISGAGKEALDSFMWGRDILDLLELNPEFKMDPEQFLSCLRPLQHRAYSISSSPNAHPGEVHLTVAAVRWLRDGRQHAGVCSTFLADQVAQGDDVPIFFLPNKSFRIPASDEVPMIMVGPGTGIAPFRAFLEERQTRGSKGINWLFFGDQHRESDFIYSEQIAGMSDSGLLSRVDLAFSRDQEKKIYVQHRMTENGKALYGMLQEGGHFYVCGDATRMAKDVDAALHRIVEEHGGFSEDDAAEYVTQLKLEKRYVRDVY